MVSTEENASLFTDSAKAFGIGFLNSVEFESFYKYWSSSLPSNFFETTGINSLFAQFFVYCLLDHLQSCLASKFC